MKTYLAGGISGNLYPRWREAMKVYIAGCASRTWCISDYLFGRAERKGSYHQRERVDKKEIIPSEVRADDYISGRTRHVEREGTYP